MKNYLIFNGINSKDLGIRIERHNNFSSPQRVVDRVKVPGRTGEIIIDDNSYENIIFEYEFILDCKGSDLATKANEISNWLHSDYTYKTLTFSNSNKVYNAVVINKIDISRMFKTFGKALVTFEAYEVSNTKERSILKITNEDIYMNNTNDTIKPLIKVVGEGDCGISINNKAIELKGLEGEVIIDCCNLDCYKEEDNKIINCNNKMIGMFPKLEVGENKITVCNCEVEVVV
jgi:predicted phage tail component-like protein